MILTAQGISKIGEGKRLAFQGLGIGLSLFPNGAGFASEGLF